MRRVLDEFKAFAFRGNLIDLAVAVILGLAFSAVITALVDHVLMPIIASIFGRPNFSSLVLEIGEGEIRYGLFLNALVAFVLIAFALFFVVKAARPRSPPPCVSALIASRRSRCRRRAAARARARWRPRSEGRVEYIPRLSRVSYHSTVIRTGSWPHL